MKPFLLPAVLIYSFTLCLAQVPLEIKVFGSPMLSYRMITGDKEFRELLNDIHNPLMSYETGVFITIKKLSRMDLETGLVFSRKGLSYGEITYRDVNNDPTSTSLKIKLITDFLEVPFRLNYYFSEAKLNYLVAGVSADLLIRSKYRLDYKGDFPHVEETPKGLRKFNSGLHVGYGYRLVNSQGFGLDLEPNFKIQLFDLNTKTSTISTHLYNVGLACKFRFKV